MDRSDRVKDIPLHDVAAKLNQPDIDYRRHNLCHMKDHHENTPSMQCYEHNNSFFCHGCKKGGSTIDYVMGVQGVSVSQAIYWLEKTFDLRRVANKDMPMTKDALKALDRIRNQFSQESSLDYETLIRCYEQAFSKKVHKLTPSVPEDNWDLFWECVDRVYRFIDRMMLTKTDPLRVEGTIRRYIEALTHLANPP